MTTARVSIVVPAYNPGGLLHQTLDSLVGQSFTSWEAVVVDDGSSEDLSWIDSVDQRVRRLRQENAGLSRARNAGIAATSGELVAFCDADDYWRPFKLARQVSRFDADPVLDLSHTAFDRVDGSDLFVGPGFTRYYLDYADLLHGCGICVSTVVVRRRTLERVGDFDPELRGVQDWDLWLRIAQGGRLLREDDVAAAYRVHAGGMSRDYQLIAREWQLVLGRHESPTAARDIRVMKQQLGGQAFDQTREALHRRAPLPFVKTLLDALRWAPAYTAKSMLSAMVHKGVVRARSAMRARSPFRAR